tara:strand:- start:9041 stop:9907 length:867 start_codon:yes stop_codon:yes gene_type:complete
MDIETPKISVVIPSLGEKILSDTIRSLNEGTLKPEEIIVCLSNEVDFDADKLFFENVKKISTKNKGQVFQRIEGFKFAKNDYVLQLDSDIHVSKFCLENLYNRIKNKKIASVGPKLYDLKNEIYFSANIPKISDRLSLYEKLFFYIMNGKDGFKSGKISKSGEPMGIPESGYYENLDWLPGCCVLHRKENLIVDNFYFFSGKAFAEDLFHSLMLKDKGIELIRDDKAICYVDFSSHKTDNFFSHLKIILSSLKARKSFSKKINGSNFRFYLVLILNSIKSGFRSLFKI